MNDAASPLPPPSQPRSRAADAAPGDARPVKTRLLEAAQAVFAAHGYSGANISDIVAQAGTTKPMVYYHFGSKEGLFAAVLEEVYGGMRAYERSVDLTALPAAEAMAALVRVTFDYHAAHPDWIRLISVANIHNARHIAASATIGSRNATVVQVMQRLLERGVADGVFRPGVDPLHLHMLIASFCFYRISNRHTWSVIFDRNLNTAAEARAQLELVTEAVARYLRPD